MPLRETKCWHCGVHFLGTPDVRYCSNSCRQKAYRANKRLKEKGN